MSFLSPPRGLETADSSNVPARAKGTPLKVNFTVALLVHCASDAGTLTAGKTQSGASAYERVGQRRFSPAEKTNAHISAGRFV